jgi:hypothetical protein
MMGRQESSGLECFLSGQMFDNRATREFGRSEWQVEA